MTSKDPYELFKYWPSNEYYLRLGEFVDIFARVETVLQLTLWGYAKMEGNVARAVFSGVRVDAAMSFIRRLMESTKQPKNLCDDINYIFTQLAHINSLRNDIVHYGAHAFPDGTTMVTNAFIAMSEDRLKSHRTTPDVLSAMIKDLRKIIMHLCANHSGGKMPEDIREPMNLWLQAAWQYKPSAISSKRNQKPVHLPKRPPLHESLQS